MSQGPQNDPDWLTNADHIASIFGIGATFVATSIAAAVAYLIRAARFEERISAKMEAQQAATVAVMDRMSAQFAETHDRQSRWERRVEERISDVEDKFGNRFDEVHRRMDDALTTISRHGAE